MDQPARPVVTLQDVHQAAVRGFVGELLLLGVVRDGASRAVDLQVLDLSDVTLRRCAVPRDRALGVPVRELIPDLATVFFDRALGVAQGGLEVVGLGTVFGAGEFRYRIFCPLDDVLCVVARDPAVDERALQEVQDREVEFEQTQRVAGVGSWMRDLVTGEVRWTREIFRQHGLEPDAPIPGIEDTGRFYAAESCARLADAYERLMRDGTPYEVEVEVIAPGGAAAIVARGEAVRDGTGRIVRLRGTVLDISDRRRLERQRDALASQLAHVARVASLNEMVSSLAHTLSQPLTGLLTSAQVAARLAGRSRSAALRATLADVVADAERAAEVVTALRSHLRKEGARRFHVRIDTMIRQVAALVAGQLAQQGVNLVVDLDCDLPAVLGNRAELQQAVLNLVVNGVAAAKEGKRKPEVRITATAARGGVRIEVVDNGPGISPELLDRVFEAFYTTRADGLGIGLSITRTIVESHGGSVSAECRERTGAAFVVTLPASAGEERP